MPHLGLLIVDYWGAFQRGFWQTASIYLSKASHTPMCRRWMHNNARFVLRPTLRATPIATGRAVKSPSHALKHGRRHFIGLDIDISIYSVSTIELFTSALLVMPAYDLRLSRHEDYRHRASFPFHAADADDAQLCVLVPPRWRREITLYWSAIELPRPRMVCNGYNPPRYTPACRSWPQDEERPRVRFSASIDFSSDGHEMTPRRIMRN